MFIFIFVLYYVVHVRVHLHHHPNLKSKSHHQAVSMLHLFKTLSSLARFDRSSSNSLPETPHFAVLTVIAKEAENHVSCCSWSMLKLGVTLTFTTLRNENTGLGGSPILKKSTHRFCGSQSSCLTS